MARLIGPLIFAVSIIASIFVTPDHIKNELFGLGNQELTPQSHEEVQNNIEHAVEVTWDNLPELEESKFRIKELEQERKRNDDELHELRNINKKLQEEKSTLIDLISKKKEIKKVILPLEESSTPMSTYVIRGASVVVMLCFFGVVLRNLIQIRKTSATSKLCPNEEMNDQEESSEIEFMLKEGQSEGMDSSKTRTPLENSKYSEETKEALSVLEDSDEENESETSDLEGEGNLQSVEEASKFTEAEVNVQTENTTQNTDLLAQSTILDSKRPNLDAGASKPKVDDKVLMLFEEDDFNDIMTGSIIDRYLDSPKEAANPLLQSFVQLPK